MKRTLSFPPAPFAASFSRLVGPLLVAASFFWSCGGRDEAASSPGDLAAGQLAAEEQPLRAAEVFAWGGQPISFALPPDGWRREKSQSGGLRGVRFVKTGSVGEEILIAEHYAVGDRDRCDRLQGILADLDELDRRGFARALQLARLYPSPPIHEDEVIFSEAANEALGRAQIAFRDDDFDAVRDEITEALDQAQWIGYSLDDVVEEVVLRPGEMNIPGVEIEVEEPVSGSLLGASTVSVDFAMDTGEHDLQGRRVYFAKNNRLFAAHFQGLEESLPLFDRILETVTFPPGICQH